MSGKPFTGFSIQASGSFIQGAFMPRLKESKSSPCSVGVHLKMFASSRLSADSPPLSSSPVQLFCLLLAIPRKRECGTKTQISQLIRLLNSSSHTNSFSFLSISLICPSLQSLCDSFALLGLILNEMLFRRYSL